MTILLLKNLTLAFPAIAELQAIGDGEPAYGGRFPVPSTDKATIAQIEQAMKDVAIAKWKDDGEAVLAMLIEENKVCFERKAYRSKKTGKVYDGFEGTFSLGARNAKAQPTTFDEFGKAVVGKAAIEQKFYSGCKVHPKLEFWAQDNSFGRRINCSLLGLMYAGEGERFGGGSAPASADDFAGLAKAQADAEDVL